MENFFKVGDKVNISRIGCSGTIVEILLDEWERPSQAKIKADNGLTFYVIIPWLEKQGDQKA